MNYYKVTYIHNGEYCLIPVEAPSVYQVLQALNASTYSFNAKEDFIETIELML